MTKAKKWKIGIILFLGLVASVLIAIGERILEASREPYSGWHLSDGKIRG